MINEESKQRQDGANPNRPEALHALRTHFGGSPRDGWESLLSMNDESSHPIDHFAVLSEN